jgi:hypothetical protein
VALAPDDSTHPPPLRTTSKVPAPHLWYWAIDLKIFGQLGAAVRQERCGFAFDGRTVEISRDY